jgi:hypothetical protein
LIRQRFLLSVPFHPLVGKHHRQAKVDPIVKTVRRPDLSYAPSLSRQGFSRWLFRVRMVASGIDFLRCPVA